MFSTHYKNNFCFQIEVNLSSASAFNLNQSKKLSFGKELTVRKVKRLKRACMRRVFTKSKWFELYTLTIYDKALMTLEKKAFENIMGKGETLVQCFTTQLKSQ